jgi:hypothetical protein
VQWKGSQTRCAFKLCRQNNERGATTWNAHAPQASHVHAFDSVVGGMTRVKGRRPTLVQNKARTRMAVGSDRVQRSDAAAPRRPNEKIDIAKLVRSASEKSATESGRVDVRIKGPGPYSELEKHSGKDNNNKKS